MEGPNERIGSRNMKEPNVCYPIMTYAFHSFLVVDKRMLATYAPRMRNSNLETSSAGDRGTESTNAITNGWKSQKYIFNLAHIFTAIVIFAYSWNEDKENHCCEALGNANATTIIFCAILLLSFLFQTECFTRNPSPHSRFLTTCHSD